MVFGVIMSYITESKSFFLNTEIEDVERFDLMKFMLYDCDVYDPMTSDILDNFQSLEAGGQFRVEGDDGRPDIISDKIYGSTQYWWAILLYNGFQSFNDIVHAQELRYPALSDVEDFYFNLKVRQNQSDKE
jgi:hypothetical protein